MVSRMQTTADSLNDQLAAKSLPCLRFPVSGRFQISDGPPFSFFSRGVFSHACLTHPRPFDGFCLGLAAMNTFPRGCAIVVLSSLLHRLLTTHVSAPPFFFFSMFLLYTRSTGDTGCLFSHGVVYFVPFGVTIGMDCKADYAAAPALIRMHILNN